MTVKRKIFVGSSSEALKMAESVGEVIKEAGMVPLVWNTIFPPGVTLLEAIEKLPSDIDGAVLLWTPDILCKRGNQKSFDAPVANVVFEYGYLAACLTRTRVAICQFGDATIPSDLGGMMFVSAGNYEKGAALPLPEDAKMKLHGWLKRLPLKVDEIPAIYRVHGYSGTWEVDSHFSRWRGYDLGESDLVTFHGTTFLLLTVDGEKGSGTQAGELYISIDNYKATYQIANQVDRAAVNEAGTLSLHCKVLSRIRIEEEGQPREARFREELFGSEEFSLELKPVSDKPKRLKGEHNYPVGAHVYQEAEEDWKYVGF